jgi:hypothetical protein
MNHPPMDDSLGESFDSPSQSAAPDHGGDDPYQYARTQLARGVEPKEIGKNLRAAGYAPEAVAEIMLEALKPQQGGQAQAGAASGGSRGAILFALTLLMAGLLLKCLGATGPTGTVIFLLLDFAGLALIVRAIVKKRRSPDEPSMQS